MTTNKFFNIKKDDSYLAKFMQDTVIFGENLINIISKTFTNNSEILNEYSKDDYNAISFCSEVLPFYCKNELTHDGYIFKTNFAHSTVLYNNVIYIYGMHHKLSEDDSSLIQYDINTRLFTKIEDIDPPKLRYFATSNLIYSSELKEHCILIYGGKTSSHITNDTYIYIISKKTWKRINTSYQPPPLYGHVSFNYKNIVFIHGGNMGKSQINNDIWCYLEKEKKWVKIMNKEEYYKHNICKPSSRYFHSCAINVSNQVNDIKAFIFGGLNSKHECVQNVFWSYSVKNGKWEHINNCIGSIPIERYGHSSMVLNQRWFIVYGGFNSLWYQKSQLLDIYAYDIKLNAWSCLNVYGMSPATHHFFGNIVKVDENGYFFIFGGLRNNKPSCNVYKFIPLYTSNYFKVHQNRLDELNDKLKSFQRNRNFELNPSHKKEITEIKESINVVNFTLVRYIQLLNDINEKIKISNKLTKYNYSHLLKKFESHQKYYESLTKRIQALDNLPEIPLSNIKENFIKDSKEKNIIESQNSSSSASYQGSEINYESLIYDGFNINKKE